MPIHRLSAADTALVAQFYREGPDYWLREGFRPTGIRRQDPATDHGLERLVKDL